MKKFIVKVGTRNLKKQIVFILIFSLFCMAAMPALAAGGPTFYCNEISGDVGDTVTLTIGVREQYTNVGGLNMRLEFDEKSLTYTEGSRKLLSTELKDGDLNTDTAVQGKLSFLWSKTPGVTLQGDIVSYQFVIRSKNASLKIYINEMFKDDEHYTDIIERQLVVTPAAMVEDNTAVQNVISKIDAIGTVAATAECKQKIEEARAAYAALTAKEQAAVTNYSVLTNAEIRYNTLIAQTSESALQTEISGFKAAHAAILSKTTETVALADMPAIETAIADWNTLSTAAKLRLVNEKNLLNSLLKRAEALEQDEEERAALIAEAQGYLAEFKGIYGALLNISESEVEATQYEAFYEAKNALDEYVAMNTYFPDVAEAEIDFVNRMYALALDLKAQQEQLEDPDKEAAENFRSTYGWILGMQAENVSAADLADIAIASYAYSQLSAEAQTLLPEAKTHLENLLNKAQTLQNPEPIEVEKVVVQTEVVYDTVTQPGNTVTLEPDPAGEAVGYVLNAQVAQTRPVVWILLVSGGTLLLITAALAAIYFKSRKVLAEEKGEAL